MREKKESTLEIVLGTLKMFVIFVSISAVFFTGLRMVDRLTQSTRDQVTPFTYPAPDN